MPIYLFPEKALVNRNIPKTKFYENASINKAVKDAFVSQIQQITWAYKLSPETTNLAASKSLLEIEVFNIHLKTQELDEAVLLSIDKAIQHPIFFQIFYEDKIRALMAYKRIHESDESRWVVDQYISSGWLTITDVEQIKKTLPIALNLTNLYEQMLRALMPIATHLNESIREQTNRLNLVKQKQNEITKLQKKMRIEKQFNRKVELNLRLINLQKDLSQLQT